MDEGFGAAHRKVTDKVRFRDVLTGQTTQIDYTYDFGASWEHSLVVSDVRTGIPGLGYPRFVASERDCPLEDCGGGPGFHEMLEARADLKHSAMQTSLNGSTATIPRIWTSSQAKTARARR